MPSQFLTLGTHLKVLPSSNWSYFGVIGEIRMSSFQIIWHFGDQMVGSKVMGSVGELTRFAWFSSYLNRFNFDFDPWAIVLKGIQYFLQWNWFYPNRTIGSKVNFRSPQKSTLGQIWAKLTKSSNNLGFDIETWKMSFWWSFDQFFLSVNLGWPRAFWSLWLEITLWALWHLIGLNHNNLDVPTVPRWKKMIFFLL